ncbi:MAG: hypothetical protein L0211_25860 [Planctomycetaceae bacterium]|nr:hypothetical protein [Planctomycetaceae bacterium]
MTPILIYYVVGLALALVIGIVCYYVIGFSAIPLWQALVGPQSGAMWGRLFRMSVIMVALVGALSTKFYGCSGPTDYAHVARDHRLMLQLTSQQVSGSLSDTAWYLLLVGAVAGMAYTILRAHRARGAKAD